MWKSVPAGKYMQDFHTMSPEQKTQFINNMTQNQQYEMIDKRDGKTYYVAKLADGNVWMTEDLDYDISTDKTLTPDDTDVPSNYTPSASTITTENRSQFSSDSSAYNHKPQSYDPGKKCWDGTISNRSGTWSANSYMKDCEQHDSSHYFIGNYYNFPAAVAMNDTSAFSSQGYDMNQSICPAGWRLPGISGSKSYYDLKNKAGFNGDSISRSPYYFSLNGYFYSGTNDSSHIGEYGHWRTSVVYSDTNSYHLERTSVSYLNPQDAHAAYQGMTVRCVAR